MKLKVDRIHVAKHSFSGERAPLSWGHSCHQLPQYSRCLIRVLHLLELAAFGLGVSEEISDMLRGHSLDSSTQSVLTAALRGRGWGLGQRFKKQPITPCFAFHSASPV